MKAIGNFFYRAFFTRDDDMDMLQVLFVAIVVVTLQVVWKLTTGYEDMSEAVRIEALVTLRWLTGLLVITAVPKWMVPFMVQHKTDHTKQHNGEQSHELHETSN
jgi:hypothetical protein